MPQNDTPFLGQPCGDPVGGLDKSKGPYGYFEIMTVHPDGSIDVNIVSGGGTGGGTTVISGTVPVTGTVAIAGTVPVSGTFTTAPFSSVGNTPINVPIGTSSTLVIPANLLRTGLNLTNISFETISLAFGTAAVLFSGITLGPGGTYWMDSFDFTTAAVNAIASDVNATLAVQENQ